MIGKQCMLRPLVMEDLNYINNWNQIEEVNKYLGNGYAPISIDIQREWLKQMIDTSKYSCNKRYMIVKEETPIGLIGLYAINWISRTCEIGLYIGEETFKGRGIGSDAYTIMEVYATSYLNLRKIKLQVVEKNVPAVRFWKKHGFIECGVYKKDRFIDGEFVDVLMMEKKLNIKDE